MAEKDIISKEAIRRIAVDLAVFLLDLNIDPDSLELIETESRRIEDRRADLVARVRSTDGGEFILHIEIQNDNDRWMPWRMLRYLTDIRFEHPDTPIRQYLIYIGKRALTMPDGIEEGRLIYGYDVVDMHSLDCAGLLDRDEPDALVLAILCDFGERDPQAVVNHIISRLKQIAGEDSKAFRKYLDMLEILSDNRDLKTHIKKAEAMLTQVDVERLPSYELGMEKGMEKGEARLLSRLLRLKFGDLPAAVEQRIEDADEAALLRWSERVLTAERLEDVLD